MRCDSNWARTGQIILTIYPHQELGFREPGRRAEYKLSLPEAYRQAVLLTSAKLRVRTKELRKAGVRNPTAKARREILSSHA